MIFVIARLVRVLSVATGTACLAIFLVVVETGADDLSVDGAGGELPGLGQNRLFISDAERSLFNVDNTIVEPLPEPPGVIVVEPTGRSNVPKPVVKSKKSLIRLDGLMVRPDGSIEAWVNGAMLELEKSSICASLLSPDGPLLIQMYGQQVVLAPGQQASVATQVGEVCR